MAFAISKRSEGQELALPKDAVRLSEEQALLYFLKIINGWKDDGDVWPLRYGPGILGGISVMSTVFINHHYRTKLKLGRYGQIASYIPIVAFPGVLSMLFHKAFVQPTIILQRERCLVCVQTRAAALQNVFALGCPIVLAPLAGFMFAMRHYTYRLPFITEQPKEVFKIWLKFTKLISMKLSIFLLVNTAAAFAVTYKEMSSVIKINLKLQQYEKEYDENREAIFE